MGIGGSEYGASYGGEGVAKPLPGLSRVYVKGHGPAVDSISTALQFGAVQSGNAEAAAATRTGQFVNLCSSTPGASKYDCEYKAVQSYSSVEPRWRLLGHGRCKTAAGENDVLDNFVRYDNLPGGKAECERMCGERAWCV